MGEFKDGATAEEIAQRFPSLTLPDVYAVITYYLRPSNEVEQYLAERRTQADAAREAYSKNLDQRGIRERLLSRRGASDKSLR